jgi:hypothetical protein
MKKLFLLVLIFMGKEEFSFSQQADTTIQDEPWTIHAELNGFFYPTWDDSYISPIVWVKRSHLHLEARYNYEDFQTISFYGGYNLEFGNKLHLDLTPMLGGSTGNTDAIIPAAELELIYKQKVGLYVETEYSFDLQSTEDNFFIWWSELYYSPQEWIWFGVATQRLRVRENNLDLQRGLFLAFQKDWFIITGYYFNPFTSDQFGLLNLGATF